MLTVLAAIALQLAIFASLAVLISRNIIRVPPNEVVVITGKRRVVRDPATGVEREVGYRIITGGSAFRIPMLEREDRLPLNEMSIAVDLEDQRDAEGRAQRISVLVNCHISSESPLLEHAIQRFLGMVLPDIEAIVRTTIESRVIDTLLTADLETEGMTWSALEQRLIAAIRADLGALGLVVDNIIFRGAPNSNGLATMTQHDAGLFQGK